MLNIENIENSTAQMFLNKTKPASPVHIFNVWIISMQNLNIKKWNLFELQITHILHNVSTPKAV